MNNQEIKSAHECELVERLDELGDAIAVIRQQIEEAAGKARATGEYSDQDWFYRAKYALKAKGREHQKIQSELRLRRMQDKAARGFNSEFLKAARDILDQHQFDAVEKLAQERMEEG